MKNNCPDADCSCSEPDQLVCNLTSPELRKRKETVLQSLREQILEKKELSNGFAFLFPGTDNILDELITFIKTEGECCPFFTFDLSVNGDKSQIKLSLCGPEGVKGFITDELGF